MGVHMTELAHSTDEQGAAVLVAGAITDPDVVLQRAGQLATTLAGVIKAQGLERSMGRNRQTGEERKHIEVGGWQTAGAMFGALGASPLHAETVWSRRVARDDEVIVYESRAEIRTLSGDIVGSAESMCSTAEDKWAGRDEFAVRGMAETRAESRAWRRALGWVVKLAGYETTPAEEMAAVVADEPPEPTMLPRWAAPLGDDAVRQVAGVLVELFKGQGVDEPGRHASMIGTAVFGECDGTMPVAVARVIWDLAAHLADPAGVFNAAASRAPAGAEATGDRGPGPASGEQDSTGEGLK